MSAPAYKLVRSDRRTLAIQITKDAQVVVRAPRYTPQSTIDHFVASQEKWIRQHQQRQVERLATHPPHTDEEIAALRQRATKELPPLVAHWAARMGVQPTALHITAARTRFGSCSGKNSLSFSLYLMDYPSEAIEAVVVHELAHIRHKNHSPAFYAEVERYLPDYRRRAKLLKD